MNNHKRDKLPSERLVRRRREAVVRNWRTVRAAGPVRFAAEASSLLGRNPGEDWEIPLFRAFHEAVEVTAARRGAERWEPA